MIYNLSQIDEIIVKWKDARSSSKNAEEILTIDTILMLLGEIRRLNLEIATLSNLKKESMIEKVKINEVTYVVDPPYQFQYKVIVMTLNNFESEIRHFGLQGWELVTVDIETTSQYRIVNYYLKRRIREVSKL